MLPTFIRPAGERRTPLSRFCDSFMFAVRKAVLSLPGTLHKSIQDGCVFFNIFW